MIRSILLSCLVLASAHAQETIGKIFASNNAHTNLEITSVFSVAPSSGYLPVQLKLANSSNQTLTATVDFSLSPNYRATSNSASSYSITAAPGKVATKDILVPILHSATSSSSYYYSNNLTCHAYTSFGEETYQINNIFSGDSPATLLSDSLFTVNGSSIDSHFLTKSTPPRSANRTFTSKFDPKNCPSHWLAYSGYDLMILTGDDWADLPASARSSIIQWLNMGGHLEIYSAGKPTKAALGIPESLSYGSCEIFPIATDLKLQLPKFEAKFDSLKSATYSTAINQMPSSWSLPSIMGTKDFQYGVFLTILIAFSILVGPVNILYFAKADRRYRLFITTPIIAISATLIMILAIIFQDGFGGNGIRVALMEIRSQNNENLALVHQEQFSRSGILTSTRFTIPTPVRLDPVPLAPSRWARYTNDMDHALSFDQTLEDSKLNVSGSWWLSRSEQGQILSAVNPTRGRIEATSNPGEYLSTLDFTLDSFYLLTPDNQWLCAKSIKTGQRFKPTPVTNPIEVNTTIGTTLKSYSKRNQAFINKTVYRPNHFFALSEHAPCIDTHPSIRWSKSSTLVTGDIAPSH